MRILHQTYQLRDVQDVEALCAHALRKAGLTNLDPNEYEDAITTLITVTWQLSERYDPTKDRAHEKGQNPSFANYAAAILRMRVTDWQRTTYGRTKWQFADKTIERVRLDNRSLDAPARPTDNGRIDPVDPVEDPGDARERGLDGAITGISQDSPDDRFDGFRWALERRDREQARKELAVGYGSTQPLARRNPPAEGIAA